MAYVINGGERPTSRFQLFVDLCCQAYNLIRKHSGLFLNLLSLVRRRMTHSEASYETETYNNCITVEPHCSLFLHEPTVNSSLEPPPGVTVFLK